MTALLVRRGLQWLQWSGPVKWTDVVVMEMTQKIWKHFGQIPHSHPRGQELLMVIRVKMFQPERF